VAARGSGCWPVRPRDDDAQVPENRGVDTFFIRKGAMDKIRFACPECGARIATRRERAGKRGKCPVCGAPVVVPFGAASGEIVRLARREHEEDEPNGVEQRAETDGPAESAGAQEDQLDLPPPLSPGVTLQDVLSALGGIHIVLGSIAALVIMFVGPGLRDKYPYATEVVRFYPVLAAGVFLANVEAGVLLLAAGKALTLLTRIEGHVGQKLQARTREKGGGCEEKA